MLGVLIPVVLIGGVSAANARAGESFAFKTTAAVQVGSVTIPAGTRGTGLVTAAQPGGRGVKTSTLDLEPRTLTLADGTQVAVTAAPASEATLDQTRHASAVPVPLFFGGVFLLGGVGHQARSVTLADGTPFTVIANGP